MSGSRVDVLIPAYNVAATLREAVESVRAQSLRDIRILIVDDGSTDETPAILSELGGADPRIEIITRANGGIVEALNEGLRACGAPYVARFDADDVCYPDRLKLQFEYLEAHPDCVAVGGLVDHMDERGAPLQGLPQPGDPGAADAGKIPALEPYIIHPFLMARREAMVGAGAYRYVHNSEDSDLYWRLAEQGRLHNLDQKLGRYRVHTGSVSSSIINGRIMALFSQLGAISALRRRAGRPDLVFRRAALAECRAAVTLEGMFALVAADLDHDEREHLRVAAGAKLMELARYRPYELEHSDCRFIRGARLHASRLSVANQAELHWYVSVTAGRLLRKGKFAETLALTHAGEWPLALARAILGR